MKTQEEIRADIAVALRDLRVSNGFTKAQMCDAAGVDLKTWNRYEAGHSSPDVAQFICIFANLGKSAIRAALDIVYPETYASLSPSCDNQKARDAAVHYFKDVASDKTVREWDFLVLSEHGSNIEAQLQEFTMIDHLPLSYRYAIAEMVLVFWNLAEARGELLHTDFVMPSVDVFLHGITQGRKAVERRMDSYTTAAEEDGIR